MDLFLKLNHAGKENKDWGTELLSEININTSDALREINMFFSFSTMKLDSTLKALWIE